MNDLSINAELETKRIIKFLKETFERENVKKAVIGVSAGIDSSTSLLLLTHALSLENIFAVSLPYFDENDTTQELVQKAGIPDKNYIRISIRDSVDTFEKTLGISENGDKLRGGNIMARVRMIILYDIAKKERALVCGTENRSEYLLSYFTRFGDEASDIEPIQHLYKTQVYTVAEYLKIPQHIIDKKPSANLWPGQTDEDELGFSYKEADQVLSLYFDQKKSLEDIQKLGLSNAKTIIEWTEKNEYKHNTPYTLPASPAASGKSTP